MTYKKNLAIIIILAISMIIPLQYSHKFIFRESNLSMGDRKIDPANLFVDFYEGGKFKLAYDKEEIVPFGDGVMLQTFYWQVPDNGKWWTINI